MLFCEKQTAAGEEHKQSNEISRFLLEELRELEVVGGVLVSSGHRV